jgi:hypothetical protein
MIIEVFICIFLGYIIGRIGDYFAGHWDFFHHWIYGAILLIVGLIYNENKLLFYLCFFGLGLIISDLDDLLHFRFYGPDEKKDKRFWGFD